MKIQKIIEPTVWNGFFEDNGSPSFLQSWQWGEFQKKIGYDILRLGIFDNKSLLCLSLVIKIRSRRGDFLFIPHGPIFIKNEINNIKSIKNLISQLLNFLISMAKKEKYSFIRIAPILEDSTANQEIFKNLGFKTAPIYMHAERVWVLSVNKNEDELLKHMRKTTRYLIRKAQRDGVVIEKRTDEKAVDDFYKIYQETASRENFVPFSKDYIKKEFEAFNKTNNALFLFAKINDIKAQIPVLSKSPGPLWVRRAKNTVSSLYLASSLIIFTESTAFYHQGASIHTKIPAAYLLQWQAIKEAKKRGCLLYNFWGIYQENRTPKSWQGLTLFKTGFGGKKISYLPTQDFIVSPQYYLTFFMEKLLCLKRGINL